MAVTMPPKAGVPSSQPGQTPGVTVIGWLLVCFGSLPLLFGIHEMSTGALSIGGGMIVGGVAAVVAGRVRSRRD